MIMAERKCRSIIIAQHYMELEASGVQAIQRVYIVYIALYYEA